MTCINQYISYWYSTYRFLFRPTNTSMIAFGWGCLRTLSEVIHILSQIKAVSTIISHNFFIFFLTVSLVIIQWFLQRPAWWDQLGSVCAYAWETYSGRTYDKHTANVLPIEILRMDTMLKSYFCICSSIQISVKWFKASSAFYKRECRHPQVLGTVTYGAYSYCTKRF